MAYFLDCLGFYTELITTLNVKLGVWDIQMCNMTVVYLTRRRTVGGGGGCGGYSIKILNCSYNPTVQCSFSLNCGSNKVLKATFLISEYCHSHSHGNLLLGHNRGSWY